MGTGVALTGTTLTKFGAGNLTLNHPEKRNALSEALLLEMKAHLEEAKQDRDVRVVIIQANGKVYSSGHDLRELMDRDKESYARVFAICTEVMEAIRLLPKPVIAQVQGLATAAGCQLVATCDLAVASEDATFATPGVNIGLFCTTPGVALARAVPTKKTMEMLLTGTPISAVRAVDAPSPASSDGGSNGRDSTRPSGGRPAQTRPRPPAHPSQRRRPWPGG